MDGGDGGFALHHAHAAGWPREDEIRIEPLPRHRVVAGARGVVDRQDELGNGGRRHRLHPARARADDPRLLRLDADHEPGDILHKEERDALPVAPIDEERHLLGTLRVDDPAEPGRRVGRALEEPPRVGDDPDRDPVDARVGAQHLARAIRLERLEGSRIDDRVKDSRHVVRHAMVGGEQLVETVRRSGRSRLRDERGSTRGRREACHLLAQQGETGAIIGHGVMRDPAHRGVHPRATQRLGVDALPRRPLHEVGSAQAHEGGPLDHHDHVAQRGQVGAARDARPHHGRELRHTQIAPHQRVVVEDARRAVLPREDATLVREVHAGGIDQVQDRDATAHRAFLRSQDLRNRLRPPGPCLHRRVIRDHHTLTASDLDEPRHDASGRRLALIPIVRDQETELEERRARVLQRGNALTRGELSLRVLLGCLFGPPSETEGRLEGPGRLRELPQAGRLRAHAPCGS